MEIIKQCNRCKVTKSETEFSQNSRTGILLDHCKNCVEVANIWRQNNKEKDKASKRKYYKNNRNKIVEARELRFNTVDGRLKKILSNIKNRDKNCDLDIKYLIKLYKEQNGKCALTKIEMVFQNESEFRTHPFMISIDRINNQSNHIKGNVRLVCASVNFALNEFGEEVFKHICEAYLSSSKK